MLLAKAANAVGLILHVKSVDWLEYFHIELVSHDVIWAEGAASETYFDDRNRGMFHNAAEYWAACPDPLPAQGSYFAERMDTGPVLETIRAELLERAVTAGFALPPVLDVALFEGVVSVSIPAGVETLRLLSEAWLEPYGRRQLGALITGVMINGEWLQMDTGCFAAGFHQCDANDAARWTNGCGRLDIIPASHARWCHIEVAALSRPEPADRLQR